MVPTTRGQKTSGMTPFDTVEYLVGTVMSMSQNVVTALENAGVATVADMLSLDDDAINELEAELTDPSDATKMVAVPLKKLEYAKLRRFGLFNTYLCKQNNVTIGLLDDSEYLKFAMTDWVTFTSTIHQIITPTVQTNVPTATAPTVVPSNTSTPKTPKESFAYGIKKDPEVYPIFKEARYWDSWNRELQSKAQLHDVGNVLDPLYKPITTDDIDLFELQKKFMYSVFLSKVTVSDAVNIVKTTPNAQLCYQSLVHRFEKSPEATMDAQTIREKLTALKLDKSWRGTTSKFITHFESQMIQLESLTADPAMLWPAQVKINQLSSAVGTNSDLASIWSQELLDIAKGRTPMTYDQYIQLLKSKAYEVDSREKAVTNNPRSRSVNTTERSNSNSGRGGGRSGNNRPKYKGKGRSGGSNTNNNTTTFNKYHVDKDIYNQLPDDVKTLLRQANKQSTDTSSNTNVRSVNTADTVVASNVAADSGNSIVQSITSGSNDSSDIRNVLSAQRGGEYKIHEGKMWYSCNVHRHYRSLHSSVSTDIKGTLIDGGANGGLAGGDVRVIEFHNDRATVTGIAGNNLDDLPIVTAAGLLQTTDGPVIGIFHQYAYYSKGKTIHSVPQLEHFDILVDCTSRKKHGKQRIQTPDGFVIPLHIRNGLAYMDMCPPSDDELEALPHVIFTSDVPWDPSCLDNETDLSLANMNLAVLDEFPTVDEEYFDSRSSDNGETQRIIASMLYDRIHNDDEIVLDHEDTIDYLTSERYFDAMSQEVKRKEIDYNKLQPCLGYAPIDVIKRTIETTTQFARNIVRLPFRQHFKSRFPALNVRRRNEPVATDTVWSDTPAVHSGYVAAQVFVGRNTYVTDVYGCNSDAEFKGILEDNIRQRGAMDCLVSDGAKAQISKKVQDILRMYKIGDYISEPYHQHQNFAENRISTLKDTCNRIMDRTGAAGELWLLCITYVASLLNHLANPNLGNLTPLTKMYGTTIDISQFLEFHFNQPVYYAADNKWPSESPEKSGRWVGVAENVGDALTYKILTDDTNKIIYRSAVRSKDESKDYNQRLSAFNGDETEKPIKSIVKSKEYSLPNVRAKTFSPDDLIGRTFLKQPEEDGQRFRARIVRKIIEMDENEEKIKFLVKLPDEEQDEIMAYNEIIDIIADQYEEEQRDPERLWLFKSILAHEGPLTPKHPNYKGSKYNILVQWEDGSSTYEPLDVFGKDDPVSCAKYAKDNDLLNEPGWKRFRHLVKNFKTFQRMVNQSRLKSIRRSPVYKYGFEIPRSVKHAKELDIKNGNTRWGDAIHTEIRQIVDYETFNDCGKGTKVPNGYKLIRCHFVFDVKHDGRHKARYVAGGHLTDPPIESVYSGVVSLRSLRLVIFLSELNSLHLYAADVGNAYLEAKTREFVCIIGGPEFKDVGLEGHLLIIVRALYGLKTSGARWHDRFADTLRNEGFVPCKADSDVWMRKTTGIIESTSMYEYICVYVDDLAMAMKDPAAFCEILKTKYNYKLKGDGPLKYHLGCDFDREPDGTFCYGPFKYVGKMLETYERVFGEKPTGYSSPLEKGDHPELDLSPELDDNGRALYMSLVGQCQWLISLGRFDISCALMTLSRFRAAPREGHMKRIKRVFGYLKQYPKGALRVRVGVPDYMSLPEPTYDWTSVYGDTSDELPYDMPEPLGKAVLTTSYVDANLYHDYLTGRSVTGVLHLVNQTPVDWYCKRQATVETATYGSEFNAARTATEQIMDLRYTLRMLGVPVVHSYMFGDNKSVVLNSTVPHSQLNKRHNALAYHRVREAIAAGILRFFHIDGKKNPADILSKHCGHVEAWPHIKTLLFWRGETTVIPDKGE